MSSYGRRWYEGNVGHPELVLGLGRELTIHQIRCRARILITSRGGGTTLPMTGSNQASFTHQAGNPLPSMLCPIYPELGVDARCAIDLPRTGVNGPGFSRTSRAVGSSFRGCMDT